MAGPILTISLDAIAANWRALDALSAADVETAAVVKADGYGLGVAPVARALSRAGATRFFVAVAEEGAQLRQVLGPAAQINVFSGHMPGDTEMIHDTGLIPMLNSVEQLTRHLEALPGHPFGIQLDSGMNRLGMEPAEWQAVREIALAARPELLMSHLACADEPEHPMNARQLATFREMTDGTGLPRCFANTGGILMGPDYHFEITRPGIGLYGGLPYEEARPVVTLDLPVIQTRTLAPGEPVGYSNTWEAVEETRIATVAAGYADGIHRILSNNAILFAGDVPCPIVGRVSMDLITVDVTHLPRVPDALQLLGDMQSVDDLATQAETIGYEILTSLHAPRHHRRYTGSGTG